MPLGGSGSAAIAEIAQCVSLPHDVRIPVLEHPVTLHLSGDTAPAAGEIVHTSRSAAPAKSGRLRTLISMIPTVQARH